MLLDRDICYRALLTRDARFDGRFFIAVRTTGIYCRPICPARTPQRANVEFHRERGRGAGGRLPALPALPARVRAGHAGVARHVAHRVARAAPDRRRRARRAAASTRSPRGSASASASCGGSSSEHLGASPLAVAQTRRVLFAKQLLARDAPAHDRGRARRGLRQPAPLQRDVPRLYRRAAARRCAASARRRASRVGDHARARLRRAVRLAGHARLPRRARDPRRRGGRSASRYRAHDRARRVDGTLAVERRSRGRAALDRDDRVPRPARAAGDPGAHPPRLRPRERRRRDRARSSPRSAARAARRGAARPARPRRVGPVRARGARGARPADHRRRRAAAGRRARGGARGAPRTDAEGGPTHLFPGPERLATADLRGSACRARASRRSARSPRRWRPDPAALRLRWRPRRQSRPLRALPGIGEWTAQYVALRALREPDAFPAADLGLLRAMAATGRARPSAAALLARAERWRPWRAYAAQHLWSAEPRTLDGSVREPAARAPPTEAGVAAPQRPQARAARARTLPTHAHSIQGHRDDKAAPTHAKQFRELHARGRSCCSRTPGTPRAPGSSRPPGPAPSLRRAPASRGRRAGPTATRCRRARSPRRSRRSRAWYRSRSARTPRAATRTTRARSARRSPRCADAGAVGINLEDGSRLPSGSAPRSRP